MAIGYGMDMLHDGDLQPEAWAPLYTNITAILFIDCYIDTPRSM